MKPPEGIHMTLAQIEQTDTPSDNLEHMMAIMDAVRTDLIVFPETQLSGLEQNEDLSSLHEAVAERARMRKMWIAYGSYHREEDKVYNVALLRDRNGELHLDYRKVHLWQEPGVTPGTTQRVVETELGNIGMIICWDIAFPESCRDLARQGADIILCPSYWYGKEYGTTQVIDNLPLVRAFENQLYVGYCDAYTQDGSTAGRSKICSPLQVLASAQEQETDFIAAMVDLSDLARIRNTFAPNEMEY